MNWPWLVGIIILLVGVAVSYWGFETAWKIPFNFIIVRVVSIVAASFWTVAVLVLALVLLSTFDDPEGAHIGLAFLVWGIPPLVISLLLSLLMLPFWYGIFLGNARLKDRDGLDNEE